MSELENTEGLPQGDQERKAEEAAPPEPFRDRLRRRYGPTIDPHISLVPSGETPPVPTGPDDETLPSNKRIERLGKLMPAEYRYKFQREVGRGGMGAVLEVRDRDLDRRLAMKVIAGRGTNPGDGTPTDRSKVARFLEEAQITGQLSHPGIVPVHEIGMDASGRLYFTMRLVKGHDLKQVFGAIHGADGDDPELATWTLNRALSAVLRVCETMAFAHSNGVIHRDLKPSNVMVGSFGETYVMDWGLAKVLARDDTRDLRIATGHDASGSFVRTDRAAEADMDPDSPLVTMDGTVVGTPAYMAPEQAKGQVDKVGPQSDVYSVGAILYHLLTGRAPYGEEEGLAPYAVLTKVMASPPARVQALAKDAPAELCAICEKAMAYSRKKRYATMLELAGDLQDYLEGRVVSAHETGSRAELKKWIERNRPFAAVIAVAVLALMLTIGRIGFLQNRNNVVLADKNVELEQQTATAEANAARAARNEEAALAAQASAETSERASRRQGYLSNVLAATSSLRLDETDAARRHLDRADPDFAGWELEHLRLSVDTSLDTWTTGHVGSQVVAWSPDGLWIASVREASPQVIELRRPPSGEVIDELAGHGATATSLAFSPDSRWLAASSGSRGVHLWDLRTGLRQGFNDGPSVVELAFSPNGKHLITGGLDGSLLVWSVDTDGETPEIELAARRSGEGGAMSALAVDPAGRWIATGGEEGLVRLWDFEQLLADGPEGTGELLAPLKSNLSEVESLAFADGGSLLAITNADGRVRVVATDNMARGKPMPYVAQHALTAAYARDVLFLPDGRLALACSDSILRVLSLAGGSPVSVHGHTDSVTSIALGSDGSRLVTGSQDGTLRLWSCYALSPTTLFTGHRENVRDVVFSPDDKILATASDDGTAWLWEAASGEVTHILRGHEKYVRCLTFSPDGEYLATGSGDRTVRLWDARTGDLFTIWEGHDRWIADLAFSPDARYLATASGDGTCRVWDVEEEVCLTVFEGHSGWVHCLAWNEAGTRLLTGGIGGEVFEWDPFTGQTHDAQVFDTESITSLVWGPDGHHFTAAGMDGHVRVVDAGGHVAAEFQAHEYAVSAMALSGDRLVTGDRQGILRIWDTTDWAQAIDLHNERIGVGNIYGRQVAATAFSADGARIASARGTLVRVWETAPAAERHEAMLAARRVIGLVDDLFNDLGLPELVLESLRENRDIPGKLREAAIRSVTAASQDPELLRDQAWALLSTPTSTADDHKNARVLAEMALDLNPTEGSYRMVAAAAYLRTGDPARCEATLRGLMGEGWHDTAADPHPEVLVLLAMAEFHQGRTDVARQRLKALEGAMARPLWQLRASALYEEACELAGL